VVQAVLQVLTIMFTVLQQTSSVNGDAASFVVNVVTDGSSTPSVTIYHGGTGFLVVILTIPGTAIGSSAQ
jgi:hypothetical protein